ncbi:fumarylacetoacetase [Sphingobacteriales bacterium UPWRP_1]|nr:fumarylacetoacetase [Sphingobacteriales bacterium TSM_CSS]PSJ71834.1 fumarylacetoacetase [Sphingobacteriales bacterium UPWRP_1]
MAISSNNPALSSWIPAPEGTDFPIQNLPFGVFSDAQNPRPRPASIIGNTVIDLCALEELGYFTNLLPAAAPVFSGSTLNPFLQLGKPLWRAVRQRLSDLFNADNDALKNNTAHCAKILFPLENCSLHLPVHIGDYTDFYSSREHATNVGIMFRGADNALMPNWLHLPVGYHGRSSSIVVSGTPIRRPKGQMQLQDGQPPVFGPSRLLDFELEMAFVTGQGKPLGTPINIEEADDFIFGLMLFNDWSARDIQKWEYQPLGPFLGKNFGSSVSPWIVTLDALEPFRTAAPVQEPAVLPYLQYSGNKALNINLSVFIQPEGGAATQICSSNTKYLYWTMEQQLAHHTVNGCNINAGDMLASGTISGPTPNSFGSMLELTWRGTKPLTLSDGAERKFIADGDTVIMKGYAQYPGNGLRIGFGEVSGKVLPAL